MAVRNDTGGIKKGDAHLTLGIRVRRLASRSISAVEYLNI